MEYIHRQTWALLSLSGCIVHMLITLATCVGCANSAHPNQLEKLCNQLLCTCRASPRSSALGQGGARPTIVAASGARGGRRRGVASDVLVMCWLSKFRPRAAALSWDGECARERGWSGDRQRGRGRREDGALRIQEGRSVSKGPPFEECGAVVRAADAETAEWQLAAQSAGPGGEAAPREICGVMKVAEAEGLCV